MEERIFYVSDYHFDHQIALKRSRSDWFSTIEEMNETMIRLHNQKVRPEDQVYILGDIIVCEESELEERLQATIGKLQGHLHLICGNHDYKYKDLTIFHNYFETVQDSLIIKDRGRWVQLYHYPVLCWYRKQKGAFHIYGHLHNETIGKECKSLQKEPRALNACVEITEYEPCTLDELLDKNSRYKSI
ncbi:MAG: metallophosphoesterase family protein [bacterium]|nr:metallophosphoesterase family protein [bacterium]